ncbi:Acetyltransferase (GNAT) family protein [Streptomyces sp. AmelKG-E11A]|nr:Acetyltransferase (GNAT) family protein [Streptomyces sp. AmelKG-E11A]
MGRRLVPLTLDNLKDLPQRCRSCVYWELDPVSGQAAVRAGRPGLEKEAWISAVLLEWGSCGRVVYVDDLPVGFALYAPPAYVPRSTAFPTSPVSADAVQLMTAWIEPGFQGQGLGRVMVQTVAKD